MALQKPKKTRLATTLPDNRIIPYSLFTKADEKIMLMLKETDDMNSRIQSISDIVERCTELDTKKEPKWLTEYMYLVLRRDSIGPIIEFDLIPDNDTQEDSITVKIDLSDIEIVNFEKTFQNRIDLSEYFDDSAIIEFREPTIFDYAVGKEDQAYRLLWNSLKAIYIGNETTTKSDLSELEFFEWIDALESKAYQKIDRAFSTINNVECIAEFDGEKERLKDLLNFIILG